MVPGLLARLGLATLWQPQPWSANYAVSKLRAGAPAHLLCVSAPPKPSLPNWCQKEATGCIPRSSSAPAFQLAGSSGSAVRGQCQDGVDWRRLVPRPHPWDVCSRGKSGRRGPTRPFRRGPTRPFQQGPGFVSSVLTAAGAQGPWETCLPHPCSRRDRAGVKQLLLGEPR